MHTQAARPISFISNAIAAEPVVEAELCSCTPRRVTYTRSFQRERLWAANLTAGLLALAYYSWTTNKGGVEPFTELTVLPFVSALIIGIHGLCRYNEARRNRDWLREGYAIPATVDHCTPSDSESCGIRVKYKYTAKDNKERKGDFTISSDTAVRLGGFAVGTRFTLLLHPTDRYETIPYFQINGVEIPGAAPVRTVPPPP